MCLYSGQKRDLGKQVISELPRTDLETERNGGGTCPEMKADALESIVLKTEIKAELQ